MKPLLTLAAVLALLFTFLWKSTFLPYAIFLLLACLVIWGREVGFMCRRSWGLYTAVFLPVVLISLCMIFGKISQPMITALASTFDEYFSGFFFGLVQTTEELSTAGFINRLTPIKGYAVLMFILCTLCAWKFLCEVSTFESMDLEKVIASRGQPWAGTFIATLLLLIMFLFLVMGLDLYSPSCRRRCSGIQYRNFISFQMLTFSLSASYFFVSLQIGLIFSRLAKLPTEREAARSAG